MDNKTKALHIKIDDSKAKSVVTPIYQCSAFQADSDYFYSRKDNPNIRELEMVIATFEDAKYSIATNTGMSSISLVLNFLNPFDTLIINKDIYGCSFKLFQKFAKKYNINLMTLDLSLDSEIDKIPPEVNMVFFETPTNPFLKTINIGKVSKCVKLKNNNSIIVVDNTWATSIFQHPLKHGADISLHSATKYFSGHSDVLGGFILTNDLSLYNYFVELRFYMGAIMEPYSAWLLRRSMQTYAIRMKEHQKITLELKKFLETCTQIEKIYYPTIDNYQLKGYGTLIFVKLRDDLVEKYIKFTNTLKLFQTGTGMACVTSMVAQPYNGSHASMSDEEKMNLGLGKDIIRLSFGLENTDDIKADLQNAFIQLDSK